MKLYLDTSVYGGYYDDEFKEGRPLFDWINNKKVEVVCSSLVYEELSRPDDPLKSKLLNTLSLVNLNFKKFTDEMETLANYYIVSGVLSNESLEDALHIAFATYHKIDYIISWNYKHMVSRQDQFNVINLRIGRDEIKICRPIDFLNRYAQ